MKLTKSILGGSMIFCLLGLLSVANAATTIIYSFAGDEDGEYADTDLVLDQSGAIYGTTVSGGAFGSGTVWQLKYNGSAWSHTVIYSFTGGSDGSEPYKGVTLDNAGNLYGTAVTGGTGQCEGGCGVVYRITNSNGQWVFSVLHAFSGGSDGSGPGARVTLDQKGNIYGTTPTGGSYGFGTIYQLRPSASGTYQFKVLHAFTGGDDGIGGSAGQLLLRNGVLYGVSTSGGANGSGAAYQLSKSSNGLWTLTPLYQFKGQPDAGFPYSGLISDRMGNLYGTTYYDGANDLGCVYELSPTTTGSWTENVLYSFKAGADGNSPIGNVVLDRTGNLYGTTSEGGTGPGTIFQLTPGQGGLWTESLPHLFQGPPDGAFPYNGMVAGTGTYYGATVHGGQYDEGAIYQFSP